MNRIYKEWRESNSNKYSRPIQPWKSRFSDMFLRWSSMLFPPIWTMVGWKQLFRESPWTYCYFKYAVSKTNPHENNLFKSTVKKNKVQRYIIFCNFHNIFKFLIQVILCTELILCNLHNKNDIDWSWTQ